MRSKRISRSWPLALVCAALLWSGCGDDNTGPPPPQPGQLTVSVTTTGTAGAAFLLNIRGEGISSPVPVSSSFRLYTLASGDTLRAAVIGTVSSGDLLRFSVPDVNQASGYHVTLEEVAGTDNQLLSTGNFTATINP